jgi:predicted metal-dependent enzyme (double-stranded beta helix superfamily)
MIKEFFENLPDIPVGGEPTAIQFTDIAASMALLAKSLDFDNKTFPKAVNGQELLYPLHVVEDGPSLYLVSDAAGVQSAPHEHQTWAVIAGISGNEVNEIFAVRDTETKKVTPVSTKDIRFMDVLCMRSDEIHATLAAGPQATYHLHLYGKPLHRLPPYPSRCYSEG